MQKPYKRMRPFLGTFVEVGTLANDTAAEVAVSEAFKVIEQVHNKLSFHNTDSDLSAINSSGESQVIKIEKISAVILRIARYMTFKSHGLFNFTSGGRLVNLNILPNPGSFTPLDFGEYSQLHIKGTSVMKEAAFQISLDGIAKGYAVDLAIKELQKQGLSSGWVNAGGDLRVYGDLSLPIYRRDINGDIQFLTHLQNSALATSQTNTLHDENFPSFLVSNNKEHDLSPNVWTVTAPKAWLADALTKVAAFASANERRQLLSELGGQLI